MKSTTNQLPWGHTSRTCKRCGDVGPRVPWQGGYVHHYCLTKDEQRERAKAQEKLLHPNGRRR